MRKSHTRSKNAWSLLLLLFIVVATPNVAEAQDGLTLVEAPQIPIDPATKAGSTLLQLRNGGPDVSVSLVVSELKSKITGQLSSAKVTFSLQPDVPGKPVFPQDLKTGKVLVLKVDVSNVTEAGESTATIFQDGKSLGVLTAVNDRAPFGVSPSGATADKPAELRLQRGAKTVLTLVNDDAVSYPVSWRLLINGVSYEGKSPVILPPKGSTPVEITPPGEWFEHCIAGFFKPDDQDGVLTLAFSQGAGDSRLWPSKSIPIKAHLNYHPESAKQVLGNLILLLVLAAGGIFSLLVNAYLPNRLRSVAADERLGSLGGRISGISTKIDSRLRVLIRVERLRIKEMLKGRWHISPDFADALTQTNEGITALTSRVAAAEQLDSERHRFDSLRAKLPPTRLSRIHDDLQRAADLLRKFRPSKEDLELATTSISKASELISKTEILVSSEAKDDEFAKSLAERLTQLREDFKPFELKTVYNKFQSHIPGPFERLAETAPDPTTSSPRDYTAIDIDLVKLAVILDYVRIHEGRSEALREKLREPGGPEEQLMKLVIPLSWECLRSAQLLVRQVQCGIYEKDLREHLPHGVSIELDKQVVRVNEPIEFSLRFHHPVLDCTAAREEWSYTWAFGDGHEERGWSAWHYFPKATSKDEPMPVQVHFMDAAGQPIKNGDQQITIPRPVPVQDTAAPRFGHRTKVEAARLAIGLLVAVVALAAGAKEKLLTLDVLPGLLAVFIIGFAADTIKNLVTQAPAKTVAAPE